MKGRIAQLDGLRGIAVLLVVLFHYSPGLPAFPILSQIAARGWVGVDLFFVLSGFLIGGIVIANRAAENFFSVFYSRRFLRIFPLYYLLLGIVSLAVWAGWMPHAQDSRLLLGAVYLQNVATAFTHNYGLKWLEPTWSLAVEEHFYLVLPALVFLVPRRHLKRALVGGIALAAGVRLLGYGVPVQYPRDFARFFTLCRMDALFYGVLLAVLVERFKRRRLAGYAGVAAGAVCFLGVCHLDRQFPNEIVMTTLGLSLLGPLFACVVGLALVDENGWLAWLTKVRPLRWIGIRAYAIYLFHMPALDGARLILAKSHGNGRLFALVGAMLTLAMAAVSWRMMEGPLIALGHKWIYRESGVPDLSNAVTEGSQRAHAA